jgi:hypothetical protein
MKTLDIFLNFPVADINRNVLWRDPEAATGVQKTRLDAYWGDNSWRVVAYRTDANSFGEGKTYDQFPQRVQNPVMPASDCIVAADEIEAEFSSADIFSISLLTPTRGDQVCC